MTAVTRIRPRRPLLRLAAGRQALAFLTDGQLVQGHIAEMLFATDEVRLRLEAGGATRDVFLPTSRCCAVSNEAATLAIAASRLAEADGAGSARRGKPPPGPPPTPPSPTPQPTPAALQPLSLAAIVAPLAAFVLASVCALLAVVAR